MGRRIVYKVRVVTEGVFWLVLLVFSGIIFIFTLIWAIFSFSYYSSRVEMYEDVVIEPEFRGIVKNYTYKKFGDLEFAKVLVDNIWSEEVFLIQPLDDPDDNNSVVDFINLGDSVIKAANSYRVIIVKQNGRRKEGRLVRCSVERESVVFSDDRFR